MTPEYIQTRIAATEALIESYEAAVLSLSTNDLQSYTLDTGQSSQTVTRKDLSRLNSDIDKLYSRLSMLHQRLNGNSSRVMRPGF